MFTTDLKSVSSLPSPALGLLPAVHDAQVEEISAPPAPPAAWSPQAHEGQVLKNSTGQPLVIPEFAGWPALRVRPGKLFASDGRCYYEVARYAATNSYYPQHFERTLFTVHITPQMLPLGGVLRFERAFCFRLFNNITNAVWRVVWEAGVRTSVEGPSIGPNLERFDWLPPLLDQEIVLTDIESWHGLGVVIANGRNGYESTQLLYDRTLGSPPGSVPEAPDFALRCRLTCFDTEDSAPDPRGYAAYTAVDITKLPKK